MAAAPAQVRRAAIAACAAVLAAVLPGPAAVPAGAAVVTDPAAVVNPFIGTSSAGNDFPGAVAPFGMLAVEPGHGVPARGRGLRLQPTPRSPGSA